MKTDFVRVRPSRALGFTTTQQKIIDIFMIDGNLNQIFYSLLYYSLWAAYDEKNNMDQHAFPSCCWWWGFIYKQTKHIKITNNNTKRRIVKEKRRIIWKISQISHCQPMLWALLGHFVLIGILNMNIIGTYAHRHSKIPKTAYFTEYSSMEIRILLVWA